MTEPNPNTLPEQNRPDDEQNEDRRRGTGRVLATISLIVAIITLIIVLLLRMCGSEAVTTTPIDCTPGMSAYEVWLSVGNDGSVEDFLKSIVGEKGADGFVGSDGFSGEDGASAYQQWLDAGNKGSEQDFLDSLIGSTGLSGAAGAAGISAYQLWLNQGHTGSEADFLDWLVGPTGTPGADGQDGTAGAAGQSAYELWLQQPGNDGKSEIEFLASLIGLQGPAGVCTVGDTGPPGQAGADGADGLSAFDVWLQSNPGGTIEGFWEFLTGPVGATGATGPQGIQGIQGIPGTSGISSTYSGTFLSLFDQTATAVDTRVPMFFEETYLSNGVSITPPNGSTCDKNANKANCQNIKFTNAGTYNIQFSAQMHNNAGGGAGDTATIWLGLNGGNASYSATNVTVSTNNPYQVAAWNFFLPVNAGDTAQLYWSTDNTSIRIEAVPETNLSVVPGIPSLILTVNQVG